MEREFEKHHYWALILGGSSGLGLASAKKLAAHGMNICIIHRNTRTELPAIRQSFTEIENMGVKLLAFNTDLLNLEKRTGILEQLKTELGDYGRIRCLLHSIAKGSLKPMVADHKSAPEKTTLGNDDYTITLQNMAISLYDWTQAIFTAGLFADDSRVLSFTSEGSKKAWRHYAAVSAAKAALEAITRSIALEFAAYGIRANCIQAGVTDTPSLRMIPQSDTLIANTLKRNPFKRLTTPQDIANIVYLLCKEEAAWVNGAIIPVDGGEQIN